MLKVGMIGCGDIARTHANGWLTLGQKAVITAVSDVVEESARAMAERVGGASVYTDFRRLIDDADVQAVDICLPHHLHRDTIVAATRAGKHVICEKPLCLSLSEVEDIAAAIRAGGVTMMCAHNQLFDLAVQKAREMLASDALGNVFLVRTCDCGRRTKPLSEWGWRAASKTMGGGCLIDTGYHPSYLLLNLADQEPVGVSAVSGCYHITTLEGEDSALVIVRFANGAMGEVLTSWAWDWPEGVLAVPDHRREGPAIRSRPPTVLQANWLAAGEPGAPGAEQLRRRARALRRLHCDWPGADQHPRPRYPGAQADLGRLRVDTGEAHRLAGLIAGRIDRPGEARPRRREVPSFAGDCDDRPIAPTPGPGCLTPGLSSPPFHGRTVSRTGHGI
jgi:predicted dehydrogenase